MLDIVSENKYVFPFRRYHSSRVLIGHFLFFLHIFHQLLSSLADSTTVYETKSMVELKTSNFISFFVGSIIKGYYDFDVRITESSRIIK